MPLLSLLFRPRLLFIISLPLIGYILFHAPNHPAVRKYVPSLVDSDDFNDIDGGSSSWGGWGAGVNKILSGVTESGRPKILITGGAGQIGQALLPKLLDEYDIHILDPLPPPPDIASSSSIQYIQSSVLPFSPHLTDLITKNAYTGIIHLASVSLEPWCAANPEICTDVNVGGTKRLLEEVGKRWSETHNPWIIYASSMHVYGDEEDVVREDSAKKATSILGKTRIAAEDEFHRVVGSFEGLRASIVRLPTVYGFDTSIAIYENFIPSLLHHALTELPIQYNSNAPPMDLLHIDDVIDGLLRIIPRTAGGSPGLESYNLVSGERWSQGKIVDLVRSQTGSMSILRDLGDDKPPGSISTYSASKASELLEWKPSIPLAKGLQKSLLHLTSSMTEHSLSYLHSNCPATAAFPSADGSSRILKEDLRNKDLSKLNGCNVQLSFNHLGYLHHLKCEDGRHCTADGEKVVGYNWNSSFWVVHAAGGLERVDRRVRIELEEENGKGWLGYRTDEGGSSNGRVGLELVGDDESEVQTVFDVEVKADASYLRLITPGSEAQISAIADVKAGMTVFGLEESSSAGPTFDMRMTVICCPLEGNWPLLLDDHESADTRFGSTGQIPFNASRRLHLCEQTEAAIHYNTARHALVESDKPHPLPPVSPKPHDWALQHLPACHNDCDSPGVCLQTGSCRCVQADHCRPRRENPIFALTAPNGDAPAAPPIKSQLGALKGYDPVLERTTISIDWHDLLLPEARDYLSNNRSFPSIHVADGYPGQAGMEAHECHQLQETHCFSADSILYRAMRHISVSAEEAEMIVLPVYQQCKGIEFALHDVNGWAKENIKGVVSGEKKMGVVLTHDWGICIAFAWEIWSARYENTLVPDTLLNNFLVWSVMGDFDSPCYRPHQDSVIPARSCQSNTLRATFPTVSKVQPARERPQLVTWSGTYWGTGKSERLRLTCGRGGAGERELIEGKGKESNWYTWDYMNNLNNARFCPQPRGIAGWSPRLNDAIWTGCIPILLAEGTHYPFATILDWSKFSIRILSTELDHLEAILEAIPLEKVEEMQANLMVLRDAFLYASDEAPEEELDRRGPMFWALHEAGMRMRTVYPTGKGKSV